MSTYTDLHQRIKDNITVIRRPGHPDDGMTPQLVKLMNPENEYYGTFKGKAAVESGTLNNVEINGSYIHNAELSNVYLNGVNLDNVTQDLINISVGLTSTQDVLDKAITQNAECHAKIFNTLSNEITQTNANVDYLSSKHDLLSTQLSVEISAKFISLNSKIDVLSTSLSNDIDDLSTSLSNDIDDLSTSLSNDIDDLSTNLSIAISSLSISTCESIDNVISKHDEDVKKINSDIANKYEYLTKTDIVLDKKIDSSIASEAEARKQGDIDSYNSAVEFGKIDKHYSFASYPMFESEYDVQEYAINYIDTNAPIAMLRDNSEKVVGKVTNVIQTSNDDTAQISSITIEFFSDLSGDLRRILDNGVNQFVLTTEKPIIDIGSNYQLEWTSKGTCNSIDDIVVNFRTRSKFLTFDVLDGTERVGLAKNLAYTGYSNNDIASCDIAFLDGSLIELSSQTTYDLENYMKYVLSGRNLLIYKKYVQKHAQMLSDVTTSLSTEFGFIPEHGIHSTDDGQISSIDVTMFRDGKTPINIQNLVPNDEMSSRVDIYDTGNVVGFDATTSCVNEYEKRRIYVYHDKPNSLGNSLVSLSVGCSDEDNPEYNKRITDNFDNLYVSLYLEGISQNVYKLNKNGNIFTYHDDDDEYVSIEYSGMTLYANVNGAKITVGIDSDYYNVDCHDKLLAKSQTIDNSFSHIDELYENIDTLSISNNPNPYTLNEDFKTTDIYDSFINLRIPPKIQGKSREFIVSVSIRKNANVKKVKLNFICPYGTISQKFEWLGKKVQNIYALAGNITTIQFREIYDDKFVITDVDDSFLAKKILEQKLRLDDAISAHCDDINNLYRFIEDLSTSLSNDIEDLSTSLSNDIEDLSTSLSNDIYNLSVFVSNDISVVKQDLIEAFDQLNQKNNIKGAVWIIDHSDNKQNTVKTDHLSTLLMTCELCEKADSILSNGWMFIVKESSHNTMHRFTIDGVELEEKDYIVVKSHQKSGVVLSSITSSDIYVIDAIDDYGKFESLSTTSMSNMFFDDVESSLNEVVLSINSRIDDTIAYVDAVSNYISTEMTADYNLENDAGQVQAITSFKVAGGTYDISSRSITSSDVNGLEELVDAKIQPVSTDLSVLKHDFQQLCSSTFVDADIISSKGHISSFNLVLTDPTHPSDTETHRRYFMTFEMGTLVLKPLN